MVEFGANGGERREADAELDPGAAIHSSAAIAARAKLMSPANSRASPSISAWSMATDSTWSAAGWAIFSGFARM